MFPILYRITNITSVITLLNLTRINNLRLMRIRHTRLTGHFLFLLQQLGLLRLRLLNSPQRPTIDVQLIGFNQICVFHKIIQISKPGRSYFISVINLRLLVKRTGQSIFILNTNRGLITHQTAIQYKLGGQLICYIV